MEKKRDNLMEGDLGFMPFPEILQWLERNGKTGVLRVETGPEKSAEFRFSGGGLFVTGSGGKPTAESVRSSFEDTLDLAQTVLKAPGSRFRFMEPDPDQPEPSGTPLSGSEIIMECLKRSDEESRGKKQGAKG